MRRTWSYAAVTKDTAQRSKWTFYDAVKVARRKLRQIEIAGRLDDLRVPPGNHLEALKSDRSGQYSLRINDQWRVCFRWTDADAENVVIVDYH